MCIRDSIRLVVDLLEVMHAGTVIPMPTKSGKTLLIHMRLQLWKIKSHEETVTRNAFPATLSVGHLRDLNPLKVASSACRKHHTLLTMAVKIAMALPLLMQLLKEVMFAQALLSVTDFGKNLPCQSTHQKASKK